MAVCACPQGIIRRDCEYHQEVAERFLESINRPARLGEPVGPPLIAQHRKDPT